jgi:hypothetical protein
MVTPMKRVGETKATVFDVRPCILVFTNVLEELAASIFRLENADNVNEEMKFPIILPLHKIFTQ